MSRLIKGLAWLLLGVAALVAALVAVRYLGSFVGLVFLLWGVGLAVFSFRRSIKAFLEFWRSRIGRKVEIGVTTEKSTYVPGDAVNVTVSVRGKQELDIQEGRVDLLYANRYVYTYRTSDSGGGSSSRSKEVTDEIAVGTERVLEEGKILSGSYSGREITFEVPPSAPPSASGEITSVDWKLRVTLGIRGAPDVIEEVPVTVLSSSESYASWAETAPELDTSGACDMEFRLPGRSFRVGERIEGVLVVTPRQDFESRALRVDLVRREIVPRGSGNARETVPASVVVEQTPRFQTGTSREYAFAMDVPEAAGPCLRTEQTYVGWWLRATVDREMALDYELKRLLNVYNGPTTNALGRCPVCGVEVPRGASFCINCGGAISREETPEQAQQDAPSAAGTVERTLTAPGTPQQPAPGPPPAPPSGPNRAQRGFALGVFGVVGGVILLGFLALGALFVLVILLFFLAAQ